MLNEIEKLYNILAVFLGESKGGYDERNFQYQFPCPRCIEKDGHGESCKYNLEVNLQKQVFQCWKCASSGDDEMKGTIVKLIKLYGNDKLLEDISLLFIPLGRVIYISLISMKRISILIHQSSKRKN